MRNLIWIMAALPPRQQAGTICKEIPMGLFARLDHHNDLMNRMADTVHADLPGALMRGDLTGQDLRNAVLRCTGCTSAAECSGWLADHAGGAEHTPDYCRNSALLERLKG
jgi:hypothetical protein